MNNVAKIRTFPSVGDVAMMLLLFCVTQLVVGLLLRVVGIVAPVTSAIEDNISNG